MVLFSSESVNEGHPDKLCDQVSDAILDACFSEDPNSMVACETSTGTNFVIVFGEITTSAHIDYDAVVRKTLKSIGFDSVEKGLDYRTCEVIIKIGEQSPDIAQGVHIDKKIEDIKQRQIVSTITSVHVIFIIVFALVIREQIIDSIDEFFTLVNTKLSMFQGKTVDTST